MLDHWFGQIFYFTSMPLRKRCDLSIFIYLPIGGWNAGSGSYSMMAADPQKRKTFIDSLSDFLDTYQFDGVDLDWVRLGRSRVFSV